MKAVELAAKIKNNGAEVIEFTHEKFGHVKRWIVEGDLGLNERDLLPYAKGRIELAERLAKDPTQKRYGLVAIEKDGRILRWKRGQVLDYCVWKPSFRVEAQYLAAIRDMALATADWTAICGVEFRHVKEHDTNEAFQPGDVTFPVVRQERPGSTVAMAFFPDAPVQERVLWIFDGHVDPNSAFSPVGVFRHELGHVLGFRHEHIRPDAPDYFRPEPTAHTVNLTRYDSQSVMHYVHKEVGDPKLRFTELDRTGAIEVYGHPDSKYIFVD